MDTRLLIRKLKDDDTLPKRRERAWMIRLRGRKRCVKNWALTSSPLKVKQKAIPLWGDLPGCEKVRCCRSERSETMR